MEECSGSTYTVDNPKNIRLSQDGTRPLDGTRPKVVVGDLTGPLLKHSPSGDPKRERTTIEINLYRIFPRHFRNVYRICTLGHVFFVELIKNLTTFVRHTPKDGRFGCINISNVVQSLRAIIKRLKSWVDGFQTTK